MAPLFHVVLHEPEIPNNTGNIGRTCVATGCGLHLIRPLGFDVSEKACRRAGLDYWPRLGVREYDGLDGFFDAHPGVRPRTWILSTKATRCVFDADFQPGDVMLFGKETRGLPDSVLEQFSATALRMPMIAGERSLNLATAVCAVVYEGVRQTIARGQVRLVDGQLVLPA